MAEGLVLPYLDIPFQHASPKILRSMKRPANEARVLERLRAGATICPDIAIRSTFVVGFPGETEEDFHYLMDWLEEAQLDRVGAFRFEPVEGAAANALPDPVPEEFKEERYARLMELTARISAEKLAAKVGRTLDVLIDAVDGDERRRHRPLQGRRARNRRRSPPPRRRGTCRPATSSGLPSKTATSMICSGSRRPSGWPTSLLPPATRARRAMTNFTGAFRRPTAASRRGPSMSSTRTPSPCGRKKQSSAAPVAARGASGSTPRACSNSPSCRARKTASSRLSPASTAPMRWRRGALPSWPKSLPAGHVPHRCRGRPGLAALGWMLAQHRFTRYKSGQDGSAPARVSC